MVCANMVMGIVDVIVCTQGVWMTRAEGSLVRGMSAALLFERTKALCSHTHFALSH